MYPKIDIIYEYFLIAPNFSEINFLFMSNRFSAFFFANSGGPGSNRKSQYELILVSMGLGLKRFMFPW